MVPYDVGAWYSATNILITCYSAVILSSPTLKESIFMSYCIYEKSVVRDHQYRICLLVLVRLNFYFHQILFCIIESNRRSKQTLTKQSCMMNHPIPGAPLCCCWLAGRFHSLSYLFKEFSVFEKFYMELFFLTYNRWNNNNDNMRAETSYLTDWYSWITTTVSSKWWLRLFVVTCGLNLL